MIVLNSLSAAKELLENRGAIYSGRKHYPLVGDYICQQGNLAFEPYSDQ